MKRTKVYLLFLLVYFSGSSLAFSQTFLETLDQYNTLYIQEKVHVHFDKTVYNPGETIWFKAYLVNTNSTPSSSTNFYTELLDEQGKIVQQKVFPLVESTAAGNFDIPLDYKKSQLTLRAYTAWMLNFDTAFLYTRAIPILQEGQQRRQSSRQPTSLRFFPEGGSWISELPAVLAFKATDDHGLPQSVSGVIKNEAGTVITAFSTRHDGMGKVLLNPLTKASYYAEWVDETNQLQKTPLPAQDSSGVSLQLTPTPTHIGYTLVRTEDERLKQVHVVAQMYNQVAYHARIDFNQSQVSDAIPVNRLIGGLLQLTVFDAHWKPLAERIVFVHKNDYQFPAAVHKLDQNLGKRGKNTIEIEVPDTLQANLSLAITDASLKTNPHEETIISRFLLSADLRGYIHNPAYYFASTADSVRQQLDLVMLTNGWRRYNWQQLAKGQLPEIKFPRERYLSVAGKVQGAPAALLANNQQLNLIIQAADSSSQLLAAPIDPAGSFAQDGLVFFDTVKVFYQFNNNPRLNRRASIAFSPYTYRKNIALPWMPPTFFNTTLYTTERHRFFATKQKEVLPLYSKKIKTLEEVVVKAKTKSRQEELEERYTSGLFRTSNARNFNLVDDPHATASMNVMNYLQSRVAGLQIQSYGTSYIVTRRGHPPAMFLNEMPADLEQINNVPISDIAYVKVIDPPFIGAPGNGAGGAISVYTRQGGDARAVSKGLEQGMLIGYATPKEFYSPDYAMFTPLHEIEDVRSTLYWAPYVLTDRTNKKIKIEFYNNDVSQSLRIVLEGVNENGQVTRVEKVIQ